ncbi:MAG: hypothetical protein R2932_15505 [Caldilineaceae bacterium]
MAIRTGCAVAFSADGRQLAAGGDDGKARRWQLYDQPAKHGVAWSRDQKSNRLWCLAAIRRWCAIWPSP